jgi:hypothetical protein
MPVTRYSPLPTGRAIAETKLVRAWTFDFASTIAPKTSFRYIGNGGGSHAFTLAAFDTRFLSDL